MTKTCGLTAAISEAVHPGATILFAFTHNRSHAAAFEVARRFKDTRSLNLVATGLLEYASVLCAAGAVSSLECAFAGNTYPAPSPSRQLVRDLARLSACDPHWTNLTITQRLMAGAMGWPFVPTASLGHGDLFNGPNRAKLSSPFGDGEINVIAALRPDVTFVHAAIADTDGNAVIYGPDAEDLWGAWAARSVVVTAERIVSPDELRALGPRPGLPGHLVNHVVEVPYGAHPQAQFIWNDDDGVASYAEDYTFRGELARLSRDPEALRAWVEEWVFASDRDAYLKKLGPERLAQLEREADAPSPAEPGEWPEAPSPEEGAAIVAKRLAVEAVDQGRYGLFFAGIGLSHLAAWSAEEECRAAGRHVALVAETGMYGFHPIKGDPYLFNRPNARSSLFHSGFQRMLGALAGPNATRCLSFLAAAQIDLSGNINSSQTDNGRFIVGSGGANDLVHGGSDYMIVMPMKPGRLVPELPFITSPATRVVALATDLGTLEPMEPGGQLRITAVVGEPNSERTGVERIRTIYGDDIEATARVRVLDPPRRDEIGALRAFDPQRVILT